MLLLLVAAGLGVHSPHWPIDMLVPMEGKSLKWAHLISVLTYSLLIEYLRYSKASRLGDHCH